MGKRQNLSDSAMDVLSGSLSFNDDDEPNTGDQPVDDGQTGDGGHQDDNANEGFVLDDFDPDHPMYQEPDDEKPADDQPADDPSDPPSDDAGDEGPPADANDKQRYQYWQSQHDKLKAKHEQELAQMKQQVEQMQTQFQQMQQGGQQQQPARKEPTLEEQIQSAQASLSELQAPQVPQKPQNFNSADAYTDPDSESFQYQRRMEQYQQERMEFLEKRGELKEKIYDLNLKRVEEPAQEAIRTQQLSRQEKVLFDTLQNNFKLSQAEATEFVQTMSDPKSLSLDNLVNFYRFQKGMASPSAPKPKQDGKPNRRPSPVAAPPPIKSGSGSTGTDSPDDHDSFSKGLLSGKDMF